MRRAADAEVLAVLHRHNASPYSAVGNGQLLDRVPEPLRLVHYTRRAIPAEYAASFGYYHRKIGDVHLDGLPEPMQRELMFVVWRIVELGGRVPCGPLGLLARELAATAARLRDQGQPGSSLLDRTPAQWRTELATTWARRTKALPNPNTLRTIAGPLDRACKLLWFGYDQSPWWRREVWDPVMDDRIPRRDHEPISNTVHWHRIDPAWLRLAALWQLKTLLETDRLRWATVETPAQRDGRVQPVGPQPWPGLTTALRRPGAAATVDARPARRHPLGTGPDRVPSRPTTRPRDRRRHHRRGARPLRVHP